MEDKLLEFETAKLANEKGYTSSSTWNGRLMYNIKDGEIFVYQQSTPDYACERCTQSLLQKWLRDVHKIHIHILYVNDILIYKPYVTTMIDNTEYDDLKCNKSYEDALEEALVYALNKII